MRVIRVDIDRPLANPDDQLFPVPVAIVPGHRVLPRHEVKVVGFRIVGSALLDRLPFGRQQLELQRPDDGP